jgi:preprotein translocase subunit SecE
MARIRPAKGQGRSGDGGTPTPPAPAGARAPKPRRTQPVQSPRPAPAPGGRRRPQEKAGTVTKAVQRERRGSRFIREVIVELRKVSWPTRTQLIQSTAVVLVVVAIVSVYLWVLDSIFERFVDAIF